MDVVCRSDTTEEVGCYLDTVLHLHTAHPTGYIRTSTGGVTVVRGGVTVYSESMYVGHTRPERYCTTVLVYTRL